MTIVKMRRNLRRRNSKPAKVPTSSQFAQRERREGVKDISVRLQNRPGTLAAAAAALHLAGLAVTGVGGFAVAGRGLRHFLIEDGEYRYILQETGHQIVVDSAMRWA